MVDSLATQEQLLTCTPTTLNIMESADAKAMSLSHSICGILGLESCDEGNKNIANQQDTVDGQDDSNESKRLTTTIFVMWCF